ncbi:MAG: galactokinase [Halolamina sp.]
MTARDESDAGPDSDASAPEPTARALARSELGAEPTAVASAPGRVNLVGGHSDYNDGHVLPMAVDRRIAAAGRRRDDDRLRVHSREAGATETVPVDAAREALPADWTAYVLGTLRELGVDGGLDVAVAGDVPVGAGLSSSAALELAIAGLWDRLQGRDRDTAALAAAGHRAENEFVGLDCGIMDQYAAALGDDEGALFLDCRAADHEVVPFNAAAYRVVVADSGVSHDLAESAFNDRVAECEAAAAALRDLLDDEVHALRDVSPEALAAVGDELPATQRRRARHVVTEIERVRAARDALVGDDYERLGELLSASHESLREDYEVSCAELDLLVELATDAGALGARMVGGGFGGAVVCLCERETVPAVADRLREDYPTATGVEPTVYTCDPAEGVRSRSLR